MARKVNCAGNKPTNPGPFRKHHPYMWRKSVDEDILLNK